MNTARRILNELCVEHGIAAPGVIINTGLFMNARAFGFTNPKIEISGYMIKLLAKDTLRAVFAHELCHIEKFHALKRLVFVICILISVVSIAVSFGFVCSAMLLIFHIFIYIKMMEAQELEADRYSSKLTGGPDGMLSYLTYIGTKSALKRAKILQKKV